MNIIGISSGYHDSACCLLVDGKVRAAVQEERFTRIKNDSSFPRNALRYCLAAENLALTDIDCIAYYEDPTLKLGRQLWMAMLPGTRGQRRQAIINRALWSRPEDEIRDVTGFDGQIEIVDHHLSHAASAYFFSGFERAAVLTVDGVGEWPTTTYSGAEGRQINRIEQVDFPHSLGLFYSAITAYLGFEVNEGEYKVMGLAPYGQPTYVTKIRELVEDGPGGQYRLRPKFFSFLQEDRMFSEELCDHLGMPPRTPESDLRQFHMDIARSAQAVLEEVLLSKVRFLHSCFPSDNLCMAGGVALNVVANTRCLTEGPFKHLFVQPAAGDAGGCLGAAAVAHVRCTKDRPTQGKLDHVFLGPANSVDSTLDFLNSSGVPFQNFKNNRPGLNELVVQKLIAGEVVGWVSGRMEFGPRALGARSILADPRRPEMRDRINAVVKQREEFRPFAPAVLENHVRDHFDLDHASPFMLETCKVISPIDLPAVTHVDGSARVQTVTRDANSAFAALLECFYQHTGCPILLNTSFNLRGEPIVTTTMDAISCFGRSQMETLVLDDFLLERADLPAAWRTWSRGPSRPRQGYAVYTML
jgi:carbamoyltransferase